MSAPTAPATAAVRPTGVHGIRDALRRDRFMLFAQPIVAVADRRVVQRELLIRMRDHDGGVVTPGAFLPEAERSGLIREIDRWVIAEGLRVCAALGPVQLNVSAASLGDPGLAVFVAEHLRRSGADPRHVVFELTETAVPCADTAQAFAGELRGLGCGIALDDFGTGYGGFTLLTRLEVDYLKIDVEFVRDLRARESNRHIVRAIVALARDFGIETVAEGVEDDETFALLAELGVDRAQGFGICCPGPIVV